MAPFDSSEYEFASPQAAQPVDPVLEILAGARARLTNPVNWCKSRMGIFGGPTCAVGAILINYADYSEHHAAADALAIALSGTNRWACIVFFNDAPSTTHADVLALFDRAITARKVASWT